MRAGQLDRVIVIMRATTVIDEFGAPQPTWADFATVRAQLIQSNTEEFIRGYGASSETAAIFRIRWLDGVTIGDRITYASQHYDLKEIKEIGRRKSLELRCVKVGAGG